MKIRYGYHPHAIFSITTVRRVKCDETRPSCRRCTSTGRKCDGYATNLTSTLTTTILPRPSQTLTGFRYATGARDIRSFQFFYEKTVSSLAGYCGSELWSRSVLQVSQKEKPVWHALVALGALHENFENGQQIPGPWFSRKSHDTFALQQYLAAIRALLRPSEDSGSPSSTYVISSHGATLSVDVCLISCVLFVCYEVCYSTTLLADTHSFDHHSDHVCPLRRSPQSHQKRHEDPGRSCLRRKHRNIPPSPAQTIHCAESRDR